MKILFLHPNFPAQFKHISKHFSNLGNDVRFLCQSHYGRTLEGVVRMTIKNNAGNKELENSKLAILEISQKLESQFRQGLEALTSERMGTRSRH